MGIPQARILEWVAMSDNGKGEKESYTHLTAKFHRIAKRHKMAFLGHQGKEMDHKKKNRVD